MGSPKYDYRTAKAEFVRGHMSVRELARQHGVPDGKHSSWHLQASKPDPATGLNWYEERLQLQSQSHDLTISKLAELTAKRALREAEVYDHAIDFVDQAFLKATDDLKATKIVIRTDVEGERFEVEEPVFRVQPKDLVALIDRIAGLFGRQAVTPDAAAGSVNANANLNLNVDADSPQGQQLLERLAGITRSGPKPANRGPASSHSLPDAPSSGPDQLA